jgi:hypothetical protein
MEAPQRYRRRKIKVTEFEFRWTGVPEPVDGQNMPPGIWSDTPTPTRRSRIDARPDMRPGSMSRFMRR